MYPGNFVIFTSAAICVFFICLEKRTQWSFFRYFPPVLFIYLTSLGVAQLNPRIQDHSLHQISNEVLLPAILVLLLLPINIREVVASSGKGLVVMVAGITGLVFGAALAMLLFGKASESSWGTISMAVSGWVGGTGNLASTKAMLESDLPNVDSAFGVTVVVGSFVHVLWFPLLIASKRFSDWLPGNQEPIIPRPDLHKPTANPIFTDYLALLLLASGVTIIAEGMVNLCPPDLTLLSPSTVRILAVTSLSIALSLTPARHIPGSEQSSLALLYLFVANIGAQADFQQIAGGALWFLPASAIILISHGAFCIMSARFLGCSIHVASVASASSIGGAASSPIIAAYHDKRLVPTSILLSLMGYVLGNYVGYATSVICRVMTYQN